MVLSVEREHKLQSPSLSKGLVKLHHISLTKFFSETQLPLFPMSDILLSSFPPFPGFIWKNHSEVFSFAQWDCKSLISRLLLIVYIFFFSAISKRCKLKERKMRIFMHTFGIQSLYNHGNPAYWSVALQKFQFK